MSCRLPRPRKDLGDPQILRSARAGYPGAMSARGDREPRNEYARRKDRTVGRTFVRAKRIRLGEREDGVLASRPRGARRLDHALGGPTTAPDARELRRTWVMTGTPSNRPPPL